MYEYDPRIRETSVHKTTLGLVKAVVLFPVCSSNYSKVSILQFQHTFVP